MFASTYFIWTGSFHWLKYRMSADLHFLMISRNRIMLSPFGLLAPGPRSEIDNAKSWDYRWHLYLLLWHVHTRAYPLPSHHDISSYMYTYSLSHLKRFGIGVWDILHIQPGFFIQQSASGARPRSDSSIFIILVGMYIGAYPMHCHVRMFIQMMVFGDAFS